MTLQTTRVLAFEPCPECRGQGVVSHPVYDDFYEATTAWRHENPPRPDETPADYQRRAQAFDDEWMAEAGWPGGPRRWPPEEKTCPLCDGSGEIERRMPLGELAQHLGLTRIGDAP